MGYGAILKVTQGCFCLLFEREAVQRGRGTHRLQRNWNTEVRTRHLTVLRWILRAVSVSGVLLSDAEDKSKNPVTFTEMLTPQLLAVSLKYLPFGRQLSWCQGDCFVSRKLLFMAYLERQLLKFSIPFFLFNSLGWPFADFPFFFVHSCNVSTT